MVGRIGGDGAPDAFTSCPRVSHAVLHRPLKGSAGRALDQAPIGLSKSVLGTLRSTQGTRWHGRQATLDYARLGHAGAPWEARPRRLRSRPRAGGGCRACLQESKLGVWGSGVFWQPWILGSTGLSLGSFSLALHTGPLHFAACARSSVKLRGARAGSGCLPWWEPGLFASCLVSRHCLDFALPDKGCPLLRL